MDQTMTEIEIIEEQQNINNIIDDNQHTIIISNPLFESPNVIVEAIPQYQFSQFNQIESFDDNDLNQLICMNDQELIDDFLSYNNDSEEFLWDVFCETRNKKICCLQQPLTWEKNIMKIIRNLMMNCQDFFLEF